MLVVYKHKVTMNKTTVDDNKKVCKFFDPTSNAIHVYSLTRTSDTSSQCAQYNFFRSRFIPKD